MTIILTQHDRKLLMKRLRAAMKMEHPEQIVTVLHITEMYVGQEEE